MGRSNLTVSALICFAIVHEVSVLVLVLDFGDKYNSSCFEKQINEQEIHKRAEKSLV